jgi:hypothetical protein
MPLLVKHERIAHLRRRQLGDCPPLHPAWACRRLLPSPSRAPPRVQATTRQALRCHSSTQIRTCRFPPTGMERWRSVGLPSSGNCLLSTSAPPSRSSLVCRYHPCSRPYPCRAASVTCVMQPTSRSLLSGTPAPPLEPPASSLLMPANLDLALLILEVSLMFRVVGGRLALPSLLHGRLTGLHQT